MKKDDASYVAFRGLQCQDGGDDRVCILLYILWHGSSEVGVLG